jgi:hypothetical protein
MPAAVRKQEKEKMDFVIEKYQLYVRGDITRSQYHDIFFSFAQIFFFICTIFLFLLFNIFLIFYTLSVCHMPPAHHGEVEVGFRVG